MFQLKSLVALSFLFFFMFAFADDDCLWCPLGSALGNGIVQGSEWLWDGAVGATEAAKDLLLPPSQPPEPNYFLPPNTPPNTPPTTPPTTPTITEDQGSQAIENVIHLSVTETPDPVLTGEKCNPGDTVVSTQIDKGQKKAI